ncbi:MAG: hypothetical protein M3R43_00815 [Acidobacteriota bacterium]|nr:hypothetical protein [Acidobacteriota bacterium]
MTNLQLLLTIGIPSLLVILSWLQQSSRLSRLEASTDKGFEAVERKFDTVEMKFEAFRGEMVALRDSIHRDMVSLHERVAVVEAKQS